MKRIADLHYIHGPSFGLIYMLLIGAALELACGYSLDRFEGFMGVIGWHAALAFIVLALFQVWGIVRFEQRYNNRRT